MIAAAEGAGESAKKSIATEEEAATARALRIAELGEALRQKEAEHVEVEAEQRKAAEEARERDFDLERALSDIRTLETELSGVKARIGMIDNARDTDTDKNEAVLRQIEGYEKKSEELKASALESTLRMSLLQFRIFLLFHFLQYFSPD
jgi:hypothetical protein